MLYGLLISQAKGQSIYMRVLLFGGLIFISSYFYFMKMYFEREERTDDSNRFFGKD